jgi:hypothetical protein
MSRLLASRNGARRNRNQGFGSEAYRRRPTGETLEDRRLLAFAITEQAQVEITSQLSPSPDRDLGANPPIDDVIQLAFGENVGFFLIS